MAIRALPFGAFEGFSDLAVPGASYYSQSFSPSLYGAATMYSLENMRDSVQVSDMGLPKSFAIGPGGALFAQDDSGNILKEQTPGAFDFAIVHSPGGNGAGIMGDQYGNLLYACGSANDQLGLYDGTTWNDTYQSVQSWEHPMDTYEDLRLIGNFDSIACIFADNSYNAAAFQLPPLMLVSAIRSGPNGILIGANFGYQGVLMVWDGNSIGAKYPWKYVQGQILSIDRYGENWIVKTQRQVLITNGITITELFGVFDDPLSFNNYDNSDLSRQQITVINNTVLMTITGHATIQSYEYGKMKPGLYLYNLSTHAWNYIPAPTQSTINLFTGAVFADADFNNRILFSYRDVTAGTNFIAELSNTPPSKAQWISEEIGLGHVRYTRGGLLGPTDKSAEAVILNLGILNSITDPATVSFNVALKLYDFKRQLWGHAVTNATLAALNQVQIDGTSADNYKAQVGDEVTILDGINAGEIGHITAIANQGTNTETWTLDATAPSQTEISIHLQVQPFVLIEEQTVSGDNIQNLYFNIDGIVGKQFLCKFVFGAIGANLGLEIQTSYFVFNDIGYDQFNDIQDDL